MRKSYLYLQIRIVRRPQPKDSLIPLPERCYKLAQRLVELLQGFAACNAELGKLLKARYLLFDELVLRLTEFLKRLEPMTLLQPEPAGLLGTVYINQVKARRKRIF